MDKPDVRIDESSDLTTYVGSAAALVAAGIITPAQVPDVMPGPFSNWVFRCGVRVEVPRRFRFTALEDSKDWMRVTRRDVDLYFVAKGLLREERCRRRAAVKKEREEQSARYREQFKAEQRARAAAARADRSSISAEEFRAHMVRELQLAAIRVLCQVEGHTSTATEYEHLFDSGVFQELRECLVRAVEIVSGAHLTSPTGIAAARADARFQSFLASQCLVDDADDCTSP